MNILKEKKRKEKKRKGWKYIYRNIKLIRFLEEPMFKRLLRRDSLSGVIHKHPLEQVQEAQIVIPRVPGLQRTPPIRAPTVHTQSVRKVLGATALL